VRGIDRKEAVWILEAGEPDVFDILARAGRARWECSGDMVRLCSIINARSGACSQDCAFCAQSAKNPGSVPVYPLLSSQEIEKGAGRAEELGAGRVGIVTSGRSVDGEEEEAVLERAVAAIDDRGRISPCASLGLASEGLLTKLKAAGLRRYHHNIETAPSFYSEVCSTRRPEDSFATIDAAKKAGLATCSGGIVGLGETLKQRAEFLDTLRQIDPDSVPINFYIPVSGARIPKALGLTPWDCLKVVAAARLMMPTKEIRVCAGRALHLGPMQGLIFFAGADGMMVGDLLTTSGSAPEHDFDLIAKAGMTVRKSDN